MFFPILAFFLGNLPNFLAKILFELLYPVYLLKFKKEKDYISGRLKKANLQIKPKEVYKNLFLNGLDSLKFLQNKRVPVKFENFDLAQNECVVFASIHLGAFEMLHRVLEARGKTNLVVSEFKNKKLNKFLRNLRETGNIKIVKDFEVSQSLKNVIRNKEILAVMADQSKYGGEHFEILGQSVPLFLRLPIAANKLGASVVLFRTFRKNEEHIIRIERVYEPSSNMNSAEIARIFESWILEYPEQWAWNYF
ncbi:MAG: lysophospholipid acyltransferase family protein [Candidatus Fibromonas sp.]|jgi:KDO2-lipid IV(A) lauroyltransferase|nr:lysophospholipid acyltransferase family protein [Candidatus Fibromonas sp.]